VWLEVVKGNQELGWLVLVRIMSLGQPAMSDRYLSLVSPSRRTPLHFASAKRELMECTVSLLECGAQIMLTDILGLRPIDLDPVSSSA